MKVLRNGEFYGTHYQKLALDNVVITDTEYVHRKVDWHYHENPYFTYLIQGKLFESNKKESYYLEPGDLLFHNWQDAHYNIKPPEFTRGFHVELNRNWFSKYALATTDTEGSINLKDPLIKHLMSKVFIESKLNDRYSSLSIESSLIEIFSTVAATKEKCDKRPTWAKRLQELLMEEQMDYSLVHLSSTLGIHPIHLSREFRRYFGTSLGNYIRLLKLNKAFHLIISNRFSMTEVCYQCGFYDQSHFIKNFKRAYNTSPAKLIRQIS
jgi:AraC family transcriptional regulator